MSRLASPLREDDASHKSLPVFGFSSRITESARLVKIIGTRPPRTMPAARM
jgi:hypothetical protein